MAGFIDGDLHRKIKRMDRIQLERVLGNYYNLGKQSLKEVILNKDAFKMILDILS